MVPVQYITQSTSKHSHEELAFIALESGCRWIQLGFDGSSDSQVELEALNILKKCRELNATFILESRVDLCMKIKADGVFLRKENMSLQEARQKLGHEYLIGSLAYTLEDIRQMKSSSADYLVGGTLNKEAQAGTPTNVCLTMEDYQEMVEYIQKENLKIPICAAGNLSLKTVRTLLELGVNGICLNSSVFSENEPIVTMKNYLHADE